MPFPGELDELLIEGGCPPESRGKVRDALAATARPAIRLHWDPVGEVAPRRSLRELLSGKRPHRPAPALPRDVSKIGGEPWLEATDQWPRDDHGQPLKFVAQLRFSELPSVPELPRDGLLAIFIGSSDEAAFGLLWFERVGPAAADVPGDAPLPEAKRESRLRCDRFDMYDLPEPLPGVDDELAQTLFEWIGELNGTRDGDDHVVLGHPGEHRRDQDQATAARLPNTGTVRPAARGYVDPASLDPAELARWRLLLTLSFDRGFAPVGDNDLRLLIRDDDLAAHRFDRAVPLIHVTG